MFRSSWASDFCLDSAQTVMSYTDDAVQCLNAVGSEVHRGRSTDALTTAAAFGSGGATKVWSSHKGSVKA